MMDYKYPGITLADLMTEQKGLTLPELGSSVQFGEPRQISLGVDTDIAAPAAEGMSAGMGQALGSAIPQGLATLASGVMKAQMIGEQQRRKSKSEAEAEKGKGRYEAVSQSSQGQINPLKSLIANYRAAIG
jgi:hypothetical protein